MENQEQLLPGIPDELTLKEITTKLPWREVDVLGLVSRGWRNAIRSRQVYEERVRSGLIETFIIAHYKSKFVVFSLRDHSFLELSGRPGFPEREAWFNSIEVVDGNIYFSGYGIGGLGGTVYMFDLAGQRVWTQCASMQIHRTDFACGFMDGKIYVFGGRTPHGEYSDYSDYSCEVEVFDLKENRWSRMTPMPLSTTGHKVVALGEELVVFGGYKAHNKELADLLQIYHPHKDEWRLVPNPFRRSGREPIFVVQGKLHSINHFGVEIQDFDGGLCRELHSNSFAAIDEGVPHFYPYSVLVVDDEILATGFSVGGSNLITGRRLFRSKGFGIEKKEMAWREEWPSESSMTLIHVFQL